jgi:mannose/fructose-specific phosphotransferase system component IIA
MVGILTVSHGNLAEALICSVQILVGNLDSIFSSFPKMGSPFL